MQPPAPAITLRPMARPHRPYLGKTIRALLRDAARRLPELAHVDARRILIVAGEARRTSRATVRPLCFADSHDRISKDGRRAKPIIRVRGRRMLYVIVLRPRFFLAATAEQRVATLLHELLHVAPAFDGTLDPARTHAALPGKAFGAVLAPLLARYLAVLPAELLTALSHSGEVRMRQWLERPAPWFPLRRRTGGSKLPGRRAVFTEAQLFVGPLRMKTRKAKRA